MINIKDLLYKRILIAEKIGYNNQRIIKEIKILEISPSNEWVKILNDVGKKYWLHSTEITPVEILNNLDNPNKMDLKK